MRRNDGRQIIATWQPQLLGLDVPKLKVDGDVLSLASPLKWYHWLWGGWPILLIFVGGAFGSIAGIACLIINARIFRANLNEPVKYVLTGLICIAAVLAYLFAAVSMSLLINR